MAFTPNLNNKLSLLKGLRFEIRHSDTFIEKDDPDLDGPHIHDFYEIYVNVSGDVSFLVNNNVCKIQSGNVLVMAPGDVHYCIYNSSCVHEHYCIWIAADECTEVLELLRVNELPRVYNIAAENKNIIFEGLKSLKEKQWDTSEFNKAFNFMKILDNIFNYNSDKKELVSVMPEVLYKALNLIDSQFTEITHVKEILPRLYISHSTLDRLFKEYIHLTPKKFLESKKLAYAEQLLKTDISITEISNAVGFSDCSHFISAFRKKFGITPYQYRKNRNTTE